MPLLNPASRERLRRFRRMKRAWVSFWLLMTLFVVSLFSELIAHGTPWLVRFEGSLYWPRIQSVGQDMFLGDGVRTPPDWHDLQAREDLFGPDTGNWMAWAPIRYSPSNTVRPDQIEIEDVLELRRARLQRVSDLRVNARGAMREGRGAEWFLSRGAAEWPEEVARALELRFNNRTSPAVEVAGDGFHWSLSPYETRDRAPSSLRILLRESLAEDARPEVVRVVPGDAQRPGWWSALPGDIQSDIEDAMREARTVPVDPVVYSDAEGGQWEIRVRKETVQFPFRPVKDHPLGLDQSGRDVLVLVLYATRISLLFGFILVFCSMLLGTLLGGLQGYFGGKVDLIGQRLIEIYASIPFLYAMIYLGSVFGRSFGLLLFVYAVFNWIGISYYMRAEFLKLRKQPFTEAAHSLGLPTGRIMWKHILPNALVPLITFFPFSLVGAIGSLSALDYIGFGLPVGTPSWGDLLSQAQTYRYAWWLIVYPAGVLFAVILLGVFIGEGLRGAFDPKREVHWEA